MKGATVIAVALAAFSSFPSPAQQDNQHQQAPVQPAQTSPSTSTMQLEPVKGELVSKLDSKSAKQGDSVVVKTDETVKTPKGTEIPKGSKLVGHVINVQPRTEGKQNSQIAIQFDQAELKGGQTVAIESVLQSIAPASGDEMNNGSVPAGSNMGAASSGTMAGAGNGSMPNANSSNQTAMNNNRPGLASNTAAQPGATDQMTNSGAPAPGSIVARNGNVAIRATAIPGILIANNVNGQPFSNASGMIVGARRDVHLDSGTQVVVAVAEAPQGSGSGMNR